MNKYRVETRNNGVEEVEADYFERNGSGTTFFDSNGRQLDFYADGEVKSVKRVNPNAAPVEPAPEDAGDEGTSA